MMKRIVSVLILAIFSLISFSVPVNENTAILVANQWVTGHQEILSSGNISNAQIFTNDTGQPVAWIISINPKGFIVIAADDTVSPIITYSIEGNFTGFAKPKSTLSTLLKNDITNRINSYSKIPETEKEKIAQQWQKFTNVDENIFTMKSLGAISEITAYAVVPTVDYFIKDTWNQTNWNNNSPTYQKFTPNNDVTGCVPTAMSMIMHYYLYPDTATATNAVKVDNVDTVKSFNSIYDYTKMPTALTANSSITQIDQVARLMADSGIACSAMYTSNSTSAYLSKAATSLKSTFKYKSANYISTLLIQDYNPILQAEINSQFPVILGIQSSSGGHAVICDGWGKDDVDNSIRYHINMGWGGTDNNWYNLPTIKNYTSVSDIIYNIRKPSQTSILPTKINLISPADKSTVPNSNVLIRWSFDTEALKYEYQVSDNSNFTTTIASGTVTGTSQIINYGFTVNTTYYWKIRGINLDNANGPWSDMWSFTIEQTPLAAPTLTTPANAAINIPTTTDLSWDAVANAVSYDVEISINSDLSNPTSYSSDTTSQAVTLADSTKYYWRVRAIENKTNISAWSIINSFTTAVPVIKLLPPALVAPINNAVNIPISTSLNWGASINAIGYNIQIANDSNFTNSTAYSNNNLTQPIILTSSTTYFWRVQAKANANNVSAWSAVNTFTTAAPVIQLTVPQLVSPANNATNIAANTSLVWSVSANANGYEIEIALNANFTNPTTYNIMSISQAVTLTANTKYYWHVRAKANANNISAWSAAYSFTTKSQLLPPSLVTPADNSTNVPTITVLSWNLVINAVSYNIEIANDNTFSNSMIYNNNGLYQQVALTDGTTYYWRVRSQDVNQQLSAWSGIRSFTTIKSNLTYSNGVDLFITESKSNGQNIGFNIFDTTGLQQNLRITQAVNRQSIFVVTVKNCSNIADSYQLHSSSIINNKWVVKIIDASGKDITRQFFSANGYLTPVTPANGSYKITISIASLSGQNSTVSLPVSISVKIDAKAWKDLSLKNNPIAADSVIATVDLTDRSKTK